MLGFDHDVRGNPVEGGVRSKARAWTWRFRAAGLLEPPSSGGRGRLGPARARLPCSAIIGRMGTLSRGDVEHVAHLARLGLTDAELARLEGELNHILDQFATLARLDTDAIAPTAQTIELENILREDVAGPSLTVDEALGNAPAREGDHVVVPAIIGAEPGTGQA